MKTRKKPEKRKSYKPERWMDGDEQERAAEPQLYLTAARRYIFSTRGPWSQKPFANLAYALEKHWRSEGNGRLRISKNGDYGRSTPMTGQGPSQACHARWSESGANARAGRCSRSRQWANRVHSGSVILGEHARSGAWARETGQAYHVLVSSSGQERPRAPRERRRSTLSCCLFVRDGEGEKDNCSCRGG